MTEAKNRYDRNSERVVVKKYANRRLYNTESSAYVTLDDLAKMVREDRDFIVRDAKTGEDLTHSVLTQIIVEQESKSGGPTLLSTTFLRQLIRYYDDAIGKMVPGYLQISMAALAKEQERYQKQLNNWGPNAFDIYQEQARKNLVMFEQAFAMWAPQMDGELDIGKPDIGKTDDDLQGDGSSPRETNADKDLHNAPASGAGTSGIAPLAENKRTRRDKTYEINQLKAELAAMQAKIEKISRLD